MGGDVIKSFLVGLGFDVDEKSLGAFNKAIQSATLRVTALYASIQASAAGIFYGISKISEGFENMGYELRLVAPAMNRWLVLRQAMLEAYSKAGVNLIQVVKQSILFNYSLAKTKFALEAVYKSVAAKFFPLLTKQMDIFRLKIFANMPKIQAQLMKFVQFIFKAFEATIELGTRMWSILTRVWDFFARLDRATDGWSTIILGVIAAWKLLNLAFLATPLGMIIAGLVTILALYDDFKVWQEGGKSLFNWGSETAKTIYGLGIAIGGVVAAILVFKGIVIATKAAEEAWIAIQWAAEAGAWALAAGLDAAAIGAAILAAPIWLIVGAVSALIGVLAVVDAKWGIFGGHVSGFFSAIGGKVLDIFGGGPKTAGGLGGAIPGNQTQPLIAPGANSNQNVSQQTSIVVNGSADAHSVGKQVASQQDRVNFDMTRNFKPRIQ